MNDKLTYISMVFLTIVLFIYSISILYLADRIWGRLDMVLVASAGWMFMMCLKNFAAMFCYREKGK